MLNYIYKNSTTDPWLELTPELVNSFASKRNNEKPRTAHIRQSHIRQFALFLNLHGIPSYVHPKEFVKTPKDFVPYIFTRDEIDAIIY